MTRFIHDQFAKDYLEELLSPFGTVQSSKRVSSEAREIDVWFAPAQDNATDSTDLGLLGKLAQEQSIFEPFRNLATTNEILDCLLKLLEIRSQLQRQANRDKTKISQVKMPKLWILTPTACEELLSSFGATIKPSEWGDGVYFLPPALSTAIVAIHSLPETPETLWLRILGRGRVQKTAIDELVRLRPDHPYRDSTLKLLISLQKDLEGNSPLDTEDRELIMRLSPLYQQDRAQAVQEGIQQERRQVIENLLTLRFGPLDAELSNIIEGLVSLTPQEFTPLLLNLSRSELLERFAS